MARFQRLSRSIALAPALQQQSIAEVSSRELYLELMRRCLTGLVYEDPGWQKRKVVPFDEELRRIGRDWPTLAHSMIGSHRMNNIQWCVEDVIARGVPGDLIETGVWRGGATIFMRAILKAHGVCDRRVWVADSFEGLPRPDPERHPQDAGDGHHTREQLRVSLEEVQANFRRYDLLDSQVQFLKGWFKDTLPDAPIDALAVARLDGDMYGSTMDALTSLYPKLSPGGYLIVDDYSLRGCRQAVLDYRDAHGIDDKIHRIDWTGVYWRRS